jgi:signal peptidase I
MSPNLEPGDLVLVWRGGTPHIGDVVRCPDPTDPTRWLVARVIATGGDRLEIDNGLMKVNGFRVSTSACLGMPRKVVDASGAEVDMNCSAEEIGGSKHDFAVWPSALPVLAESKVEAGKLYLLSDNRSSPWSHDSREPEVGQLDVEKCNQRLMVRLVSKKGWSDSARRMGFLF